MKHKDLSVAGDGSPISMSKLLDNIDHDTPVEKQPQIMVLLNNSGNGIIQDSEKLINVMISDRVMQAEYWRDNFWNPKAMSAYLYKFVYYMMEEENYRPENYKYPTNQSIVDALSSGALKETDDEFIKMRNYFEYMKSNTEVTHTIGLVQIVGGCLNTARKQGGNCRFFIEQPETGFHPKRERKLMTLIQWLADDYGFSQERLDREVEETRKQLDEET